MMIPILFVIIAIILLFLLIRFNMRSASKAALKQVELEQQAAAQEIKEQEIVFEFTDPVSTVEKEKSTPDVKVHRETKTIDNDYRQALRQFQKGRVQEETFQEESRDKMDDDQYRNVMLSLKNKQRKK